MNNELIKLAETTELEKTKAQVIMEQFNSFFEEMSQYEAKAKEIIITNVEQKKEMQEARDIRLNLKNIRINAEKVKKKLKENILIEGRFIDGTYNLIAGTIKPIEDDLSEKEKYVERLEEERLNKIYNERVEKLTQFEIDVNFYDLRNMPEDIFNQLLSDSEKNYNMKKEAERKAEEERIAQEKREAEEKERLRIENEKLKKEAEEREKQQAKERVKQEKIEAERQEKLRLEREALEAEKKRIETEKEEAKRIAEEKVRQEKEKEDAEAEKKRKLALAPDKEKLILFAGKLDALELPELNSKEALSMLSSVREKLTNISNFIRENANNL